MWFYIFDQKNVYVKMLIEIILDIYDETDNVTQALAKTYSFFLT